MTQVVGGSPKLEGSHLLEVRSSRLHESQQVGIGESFDRLRHFSGAGDRLFRHLVASALGPNASPLGDFDRTRVAVSNWPAAGALGGRRARGYGCRVRGGAAPMELVQRKNHQWR